MAIASINEPEAELELRRQHLFEHGSAYAPAARDEIVGIDPVLERVDELVHWLAHADEYRAHGARLEPGVLLQGPPGTGKTLVSRYLATASGAVFVDVRDFPIDGPELTPPDLSALFAAAQRKRPSSGRPVVLFWDEFRGGSAAFSGAPGDPACSALTARLAMELDGLSGKTEGVLLVACTNNPDTIESALLRRGRIGLVLTLRAPDRKGKAYLLRHYLSGMKTEGAIDVDALSGFFDEGLPASGIEEAVCDAWRRAVSRAISMNEEPALRQEDLAASFIGWTLGPEPLFGRLGGDGRLAVAVHEVGHALAALAFGLSLGLVTVRATEEGAGQVRTESDPEGLPTIGISLARMRVAYGGVAAERVCGLEQSLGSSEDIRIATKLATMHLDCGGLPIGVPFNQQALSGFFGSPNWRPLSHSVLDRLDEGALELLEQAWKDASSELDRVGRDAILGLARLLVERETMTGAEFEAEARALLPSI